MFYKDYLHFTGFICFLGFLSNLQKYYSKDGHNIFCIVNTCYFSHIMLLSPVLP